MSIEVIFDQTEEMPEHLVIEGEMIAAEEHVRQLLLCLGEDVDREGLVETPARYIRFMREFLKKEEFKMTTFQSEGYDEMVVQSGIPFYSLCEHHMLPFFGFATVAYLPDQKIVGLSKLARTVNYFARGLQNQERITSQAADYLQEQLNPKGVAVVLQAKHMCMEMRGARAHNTWNTTSKLIGRFKESADCRNEFLSFIKELQ